MRKTIFIILPFIAVLASGQVRSKVTNPYVNPAKIPTLSGNNALTGNNTFSGNNNFTSNNTFTSSVTIKSNLELTGKMAGTEIINPITFPSSATINNNMLVSYYVFASSLVIKDTFGGIRWADGTVSTTAVISATGGDMSRATYDQNTDGIVDDASKLGAQIPAYYMQASSGTELQRIDNSKLDASSGTLIGLHMINIDKSTNTLILNISSHTNTLELLRSATVQLALSTGAIISNYATIMSSFNKNEQIIAASTSSPTYFKLTVSTITGNGTSSAITINPSGSKIFVTTANANGLWQFPTDLVTSSRPVCSFDYYLNNSTQTLITTANTFTVLCGTCVANLSNAWFDIVNDSSLQPKLTYKGAITHKFLFKVSGCITGSAATIMIARIYKNGNWQNLNETSIEASNTLHDGSISLQTTAIMTTNDYIQVMVTTDDGDEITLDTMQVTGICID